MTSDREAVVWDVRGRRSPHPHRVAGSLPLGVQETERRGEGKGGEGRGGEGSGGEGRGGEGRGGNGEKEEGLSHTLQEKSS